MQLLRPEDRVLTFLSIYFSHTMSQHLRKVRRDFNKTHTEPFRNAAHTFFGTVAVLNAELGPGVDFKLQISRETYACKADTFLRRKFWNFTLAEGGA